VPLRHELRRDGHLRFQCGNRRRDFAQAGIRVGGPQLQRIAPQRADLHAVKHGIDATGVKLAHHQLRLGMKVRLKAQDHRVLEPRRHGMIDGEQHIHQVQIVVVAEAGIACGDGRRGCDAVG
jgi:hypothetical protein